jgi:HEAT repeat protein
MLSKGETSYERRGALEALDRLGDVFAVPALIGALNDDDIVIRYDAISALGKIGNSSAISVLTNLMNDENWRYRAKVVTALGQIADISALPVLIESLKDDNKKVREISAWALGQVLDGLTSINKVKEFETKLLQGHTKPREQQLKLEDTRHVWSDIAILRMLVTKKKNKLSKDNGILLDDKPKPPKGRMYQSARRFCNG